MSKSILNIDYRETLDAVDSYEEYLSGMNLTLDAQLWKKSLSVDNKMAYRAYLNKYPKGHYCDEAQLKINAFNATEEREEEAKAWNKALNKNTKSSYETYLISYYNGLHSNEATRKVDEFIRVEKEKELEEQRLRDIEIAQERIRLEKIEQEKKLALDRETNAWEIAKKKNTMNSYLEYMKKFPKSLKSKEIIIEYIFDTIDKTNKENANWDNAFFIKKENINNYIKFLSLFPNDDNVEYINQVLGDCFLSAWELAKNKNTISSYEKYLQEFQNILYYKDKIYDVYKGSFDYNKTIDEASNKIDEIKFYTKCKEANILEYYYEYLHKYPYPHGIYSKEILSQKITPIILKWFSDNGLEKEANYVYKKFYEFHTSLYPCEISISHFRLSYIREKTLSLPEELKYFKMINFVQLSNVLINNLPEWIGELDNLEELNLEELNVSYLPKSIHQLKKLKKIRLWDNDFKKIPIEVYKVVNLEEIEFRPKVGTQQTVTLLNELQYLTKLRVLKNYNSKLEVIPSWIGNLSSLERISFGINKDFVTNLPESFKNLKNLKEFPFDFDEFSEIAHWTKEGCFPNIEWISFHNNLTELPIEIKKFKKLTSLYVSQSSLKEIPEWIEAFSELKVLSIRSDNLKTIPNSFGNLKKLEKLDLTYTPIRELPSTMCNLHNLKYLYLNYNYLHKIPKCILKLSNFADNYELEWAMEKLDRDKNMYQQIKSLNSKSAYKKYLKEFPDGIYKDEAKQKINELPDESLIKRIFG